MLNLKLNSKKKYWNKQTNESIAIRTTTIYSLTQHRLLDGLGRPRSNPPGGLLRVGYSHRVRWVTPACEDHTFILMHIGQATYDQATYETC